MKKPKNLDKDIGSGIIEERVYLIKTKDGIFDNKGYCVWSSTDTDTTEDWLWDE